MVIYYKTRSQARTFAQAKPDTRKAASVKTDKGCAVLLNKKV